MVDKPLMSMMTIQIYDPFTDDIYVETDSGICVHLDALDQEWHLIKLSDDNCSILDSAMTLNLDDPRIHPIY